ncbi:MAG: DegQ family serine endoprotease [Chloroherpetonaceae bacterium]|nr:DegQ family serine endoprotease [Chloroherpetonaceae bacterium]MCS7210055.1 DegQ family serine endoprotease [Chloroherpetonaceae bacterium]MDW8018480.1 DegQ family serine endoprotease [Chloroherpetonaceae bacterium]
MNRNTLLTAIGLIFIGIVIGVLGITGLQMTDNIAAQQQSKSLALGNPTYTPRESMQAMRAVNQAFIDVASVAKPAVVSIYVEAIAKSDEKSEEGGETMPDDMFHFFFRQQPRGLFPMRGSGSGVIISSDGYILTNHHVVNAASNSGTIRVVLDDKREFRAKFVGSDPLTDIALVKIDAKDLPVMPFGDSDEVKIGEWVIAIGNPFQLSSTVTAGIVSAIGRGNLRVIEGSYSVESFIQTDAAINPGNSGGALVNIEGKLIGINTAIATRNGGYQGYGFAVPINLARAVAEDLIKYGKVLRGYIGVQIQSIDATTAKALKLPKPEGAWVQSLVPDGAAKSAGIQEGDVIIAIDGKPVRETNDLQAYVARKHPGDRVVVKVWRDGKEIDIPVVLKARDEKSELAARNPEPEPAKQLGLEVKDLTDADKKRYEVDYGVRVSSVDLFGQAHERGIQKDDVILEVNRRKINSAKEFKEALANVKEGEAVLLRIRRRDKSTAFVAVEMGKK